MAALYRRGGFGYGEVKKALADAAEKYFAEPRARRADLPRSTRQSAKQILADGAAARVKKLPKCWPAASGLWNSLEIVNSQSNAFRCRKMR